MVLEAARQVAETDPGRAEEMALFGASIGCFCDDSSVGVSPTDLVLPTGPDTTPRRRCLAAMIVGFDHVHHGRWAEATASLREAFATGAAVDETEQDLLPNAGVGALLIGDHEAAAGFHARMLARARNTGAIVLVMYAQTRLAVTDLLIGRWAAAGSRAEEALSLAQETGQAVFVDTPRTWLLLLAALRGEARYDELLPLVDEALARPPAGTLDVWMRDTARWAKGLRSTDNPATAFHHLAQISHHVVQHAAALDRFEVAVRADQTETAALWVSGLEAFAEGTGQAWAAAAAQHGRALLSHGAEAEQHFERALELHRDTTRVFDRARTQLAYGELLRRARRRVDAREQLRAALATFEDLGAQPWADRAVQELRASGESARKRDVTTTTELTPQELQVATLVRQGLSNREVAAQLFLSPRTIDFHLRNVFAKTGITSRTELAAMDLA
jgi:DNA-binding CsgD family transcriptional regulator